MSSIETNSPPVVKRGLLRRVFRVGFPQVVIVLAVSLYVALSIRAGHHIERQWFNMFRMIVLLVAGILLAIWAYFLSGWRKRPVALGLAVLAGGAWGLLWIEFDGDLNPHLHPRAWVSRLLGTSHDQEVAAQRQQQAIATPKRPIDLTARASDFPGFRGNDRSGVVEGPPLRRNWNEEPPREVWKQLIYGGYSSFAVVNGFLFTMEQRGDDEAIVCYDAADGNELWVQRWPGKFDESMGGAGPRSTPTVDRGEVFALGALGRLVCLDGKTGSLKWSVETLQGNKNLSWAMSGSPLVYGNLVVVNPGRQNDASDRDALVAYDRSDGHKVWGAGKTQAGYSSPMLVRLGGHRQILLLDGPGLGGYDPETGAELWRFPWKTQDGINVAQPVVLERRIETPPLLGAVGGGMASLPILSHSGEVFIASGYGRGGALLRVEENAGQWQANEVWLTDRPSMRCKFSSPVAHDGFLYGLDDGNLQCIDLSDGRKMWTDDRHPQEGGAYRHGQILLCNDLLVVLTEFGEVALVEARPDRFSELGRLKVLKGNKTWSNPALVDGRLYIRNHLQMACVDLR